MPNRLRKKEPKEQNYHRRELKRQNRNLRGGADEKIEIRDITEKTSGSGCLCGCRTVIRNLR